MENSTNPIWFYHLLIKKHLYSTGVKEQRKAKIQQLLDNKYFKSMLIIFGTLFLFVFIDSVIYGISYDELTTTGSAILTVFILYHISNLFKTK